MPVYQLPEELIFPPVDGAEDGIVAIGGDLSPERLLLAYHSGIFPWFNKGEPIVWWSPDPRFVLFVDKIHVSKSMQRVLKSGQFKVTYNQDFEGVINNCKKIKRKDQDATWITDEMKAAYVKLHELGKATSIEVWKDDELVGGLYGIPFGKIFSGKSMFSKVSNASKVALITFINKFREEGGHLLDCQMHTPHLESLGGEEMDREDFLRYL